MSKTHDIAHRLYVGEIEYDFIGKRKLWYRISAVVLLICALALLIRGLNLGIEFRGGSDFQATTANASTKVDEVRKAVASVDLPDSEDINVTSVGSNTIRVQLRALESSEVGKVKQAIGAELGIAADEVAYSLIGPSWGSQITTQGLLALGVFLVLVMGLIGVYFRDFKMSIAAVVALLHDLAVTVGVFAVLGFSVTPASLIGLLTILGYSLYDTVVVFDKVRENVADLQTSRETYSAAANRAVNQVLVRSINTTIIGVLPVAAILFAGVFVLGTGALKDLGLALFVGMVVGAYSSIFIATPLLAQIKEREPANAEHRAKLERSADKLAAKAARQAKTQSATGAPAGDEEPIRESEDVITAVPVSDTLIRVQPRRSSRSDRKK